MRERLIELLKNSPNLATVYNEDTEWEEAAAYLLAQGVVVPPCKAGDTVYYLTSIDTEKELDILDIFCGTTQGIGFDGKNVWVSARYTNGLYYHHKSVDFGKTVFLTKEEAEQVLAERSKR